MHESGIPSLPVSVSVANRQYDTFRSVGFWEQAHTRSTGAVLSAEWAAKLNRREWRSFNTALFRVFSFFDARESATEQANGARDGVLLVHANGNGDELGSASGGVVAFAELEAARNAVGNLSRRAREIRTFKLATTLRANADGKIFDRILVIELAALVTNDADFEALRTDQDARPVLVVLSKISGTDVLSRTLRTSLRSARLGVDSPAA